MDERFSTNSLRIHFYLVENWQEDTTPTKKTNIHRSTEKLTAIMDLQFVV